MTVKSRAISSFVIMSILMAGLLFTAVSGNAGLFEDRTFHAEDLIYATPALATDGEPVTFDVEFKEYVALGMQHRPIAYVEWNFDDGSLPHVTRNLEAVTHAFQSAGTYRVTASIYTTLHRSGAIEYIIEAPVEVQVGLVTENASRGIANSESILQSFDQDQNDLLEDEEFFELVDAWVQGELSDNVFFTAVDLWVMKASIASVSSSSMTLDTQAIRGAGSTIVFSANEKFIGTEVKIFDAGGTLIATQNASGSTLRWNLTNNNGSPVANGVYFYTMTAIGFDGHRIHSAPRAVLVLR